MAIKPLLVKIGADTSGLERGLNRAGRSLAGLAKAAGAAGVLVGGALAAMTTQGLAAVDAQTKLARSVDASANALRAVQIAAGYAGVSVGEANTAMQQLNREMERAKEKGSPAQEALAKLGLRAKDLAGLDVDERMAKIADHIKALGLTSGQASDILRDLGVRSRNMALLLLQGGDAIRSAREEVTAFGLELTKAQTDSIESANDAVARMGLVFEGLRNKLAIEVAPTLQTMADRFNTLAQSEAVQKAIERLVDAFGALADTILTEDFMQTAIDGLSGIANIAAGVAEGMVALSQNVELVVVALGGIATAAVVMGGPLTAAAGAIALVLGGMALWKRYSTDMAEGSDTAKSAQQRLNEALELTPEAAKAAGIDIIKLANDNKKFAESALDAAEASLAQQEAMLAAEKTRLSQVNKDVGEGEYPVLGTANMLGAGVIEARQRLNAARAAVDKARQSQGQVLGQVIGSSYGDAELPTTLLRSDGTAITPGAGDDQGDVTIKPLALEPTAGVSSAEQLREQLEQRLEVLTEGLMTEREVVAQWYEEGQTVLEDALAKGLLTEEEYREQRERLEEEHQKRMNAIKQAGAASDLATVMGAGEQILSAIGQNNKKAMKIAKVFGAAQALINTYIGASEAMRDPTMTTMQRFAAAAAVIAQGIGFVNSIKGVSDSGSSGGGGSTAASSAATAPAMPTQTVAINLQGDTFSRSSVEGLLEQIQSQLDRGGRLVFQ